MEISIIIEENLFIYFNIINLIIYFILFNYFTDSVFYCLSIFCAI
jgi:hypothetical protein